jgi:hypothetical protein
VKTLFVVTRSKGPAWDSTKPLREQPRWDEHAVFMNRLAADGFVVLGGPIGEGDEFMLVVKAAEEQEISATLARDPWSPTGLLTTRNIQRWTILLEGPNGAATDLGA